MDVIKNYRLRPLEDKDLEKVLEWRNSDHISSVMFTDQVITMDQHRTWYEKTKQDENTISLIYEIRGRPAGVVNIVRIDRRNGLCYWGFYLGEAGLPRGTGTVMGYLAIEFVFETIGLRKLCGEVIASNVQSVGFHKKLGFVEEGRFLKHVLKGGGYEDIIALALFKDKWSRLKYGLRLSILNDGAKA